MSALVSSTMCVTPPTWRKNWQGILMGICHALSHAHSPTGIACYIQYLPYRYYYCLQVCQDIRERRIIPNKEVNLELMALLIQSSAGDYDPLEHKPGYTEEFTKFLYETNESLVCVYLSRNISLSVWASLKYFALSWRKSNCQFLIAKDLWTIFPPHYLLYVSHL